MFSLISILFAYEKTKSSVDDCVGDDCIVDTGSDSVDTGPSVDTGVTEDTQDTQIQRIQKIHPRHPRY